MSKPNAIILTGDANDVLPTLPPDIVTTCITSPPYWTPHDGSELGMETSLDAYVDELVRVFRKVRRVLRDDGTIWLNLGHPLGMPWRVAYALEDDDWILLADIIWVKPCKVSAPSVRHTMHTPTSNHEYLFLLSKTNSYHYDADLPTVWEVPEEHEVVASISDYATFPTALVEPCIKAGSWTGDIVLDPFAGSGMTGHVAQRLRRKFIGIELNPFSAELAKQMI